MLKLRPRVGAYAIRTPDSGPQAEAARRPLAERSSLANAKLQLNPRQPLFVPPKLPSSQKATWIPSTMTASLRSTWTASSRSYHSPRPTGSPRPCGTQRRCSHRWIRLEPRDRPLEPGRWRLGGSKAQPLEAVRRQRPGPAPAVGRGLRGTERTGRPVASHGAQPPAAGFEPPQS